MESIRHRFWRVPDRLSPQRARRQCGLAAAVLVLALGGLAIESEGPPRLLSAILLGLAGTSNFAWAIGSLLPEARGGRALRTAVLPLALLMLVASVVWLAFLAVALKALVVDGEAAPWLLPAIVGGIAGGVVAPAAVRRWGQPRNGASR